MLKSAMAALTVLLMAFCVPICARAAPNDMGVPLDEAQSERMDKALDAAGADELIGAVPEEAEQLLFESGITGIDYQQLLNLSPGDFFAALWKMALDTLAQPLRVFAALLGTVLLCTILNALKDSFKDNGISTVFAVVATVCAVASLASPIMDCVSSTVQTIQNCAGFMLSFIPVFAAVMAVGGQAVTAATYMVILFGACQLVAQIAAVLLAPLMGVYLALCVAGSVAPAVRIQAVAKTIKSIVCWALGLLLTVFVAVLSMQTLVASGADSVMSKTTKFLIGSFVPVIGGALGDAFMATQGYMKLLKTTVGAFGLVVALFTFLPVLLKTIVWYFILNLTAAACELMNVGQLTELMKSAGAVLGILIAVICCFALLVIISTSLVLLITHAG